MPGIKEKLSKFKGALKGASSSFTRDVAGTKANESSAAAPARKYNVKYNVKSATALRGITSALRGTTSIKDAASDPFSGINESQQEANPNQSFPEEALEQQRGHPEDFGASIEPYNDIQDYDETLLRPPKDLRNVRRVWVDNVAASSDLDQYRNYLDSAVQEKVLKPLSLNTGSEGLRSWQNKKLDAYGLAAWFNALAYRRETNNLGGFLAEKLSDMSTDEGDPLSISGGKTSDSASLVEDLKSTIAQLIDDPKIFSNPETATNTIEVLTRVKDKMALIRSDDSQLAKIYRTDVRYLEKKLNDLIGTLEKQNNPDLQRMEALDWLSLQPGNIGLGISDRDRLGAWLNAFIGKGEDCPLGTTLLKEMYSKAEQNLDALPMFGGEISNFTHSIQNLASDIGSLAREPSFFMNNDTDSLSDLWKSLGDFREHVNNLVYFDNFFDVHPGDETTMSLPTDTKPYFEALNNKLGEAMDALTKLPLKLPKTWSFEIRSRSF